MSKWQRVEPKVVSEIRKAHQESKAVDGVKIELSVSPYDIPSEVRGDFDEGRRRFVIEFKYLQDEPWILRASEPHVALRIGKHSHRLYGVEVDVNALNAKQVSLKVKAREEVNAAIEGLAEREGSNAFVNYKAVESILQKTPELFRRVEAA